MRAIKLNLLVMTLGISVLGFSQKNGKEFFQHEKAVQHTTSKRNTTGWNDTKNIPQNWIGTKLQSIEGYKPLTTPKKQANTQSNRHKAAKEQLDSVVCGWGEKMVYKYDAKGNNVTQINYYLDTETQKYEYTYDSKGNLIKGIRYSDGVLNYKEEYAYDAKGNQIMSSSYEWDSTDWKGNSKDSSVFDANENLLLYISYVWDNGNWVEDYKEAYKYNSDGDQTEMITSYWIGSGWIDAYKDETIYNANGDVLFEYSYVWSGSKWDTTEKTEAVYDIDGVLERMFHSEWDEDIADWVLEKAEYTYDIDGYVEEIVASEWDEGIGDWMDYLKIKYAYDANKYQNLFAYYYFDGIDWVGAWKDSSVYDANGKQIMRISSGWDNDDWADYVKYEFAYDIYGNLTLEASYYSDGTDWVGSYKYEYEYDANGNLLMRAVWSWEEEEGDWFGSKYEYEYDMTHAKADLIFPSSYDDMYNKRLKETFSYWDGTDWIEDEEENIIYYWGVPKVGIVTTTSLSPVRVYPNPATTQLYVDINSQEKADYVIYNIIGQIIMQGKLQELSIINVESLSNGIYYLKISGSENVTLKFVKN